MVFDMRLSDSKFPYISRILLGILADRNNEVVWMYSTGPHISKSSSPLNNHLVTLPRTPITIGINLNFMFHSLFNSLERSMYLSFFTLSFSFSPWSTGRAKSTIFQVHFCYCWLLKVGHVGEIRWFDNMSKLQVPVSHPPGQMLGCAYTIFSYGQI